MALTVPFVVLLASFVSGAAGQPPVQRSAYHDYRVVPWVLGLVHPWSIAFVPGGDMLVTEQPGRLRIVRNRALVEAPVSGVPEVYYQGQGGLMDVVPHPDFPSNRLLYLSFSKPYPGGEGATTAVVRGRFENDRLTEVKEIFEAVSRGRGHYGSRLAFDPNGYLYITVGDRQVPSRVELRMARRRIRGELRERRGHPPGHPPRRDGASGARVGAVDWRLRVDALHRRRLSRVAREHL